MERVKHLVKFPRARPQDSLGFMFWQTSNLWQRKMVKALKPIDLTLAQFVILAGTARLETGSEPVTQVRLARQAKTDVMMTSQVVRKLQRKGLLTRKQSEADPRANEIELTDRGRQTVVNGLAIVQKVEESFFRPLADKYEQLLRALRSLVDPNELEEVK